MTQLLLLRGISGSGKSSWAEAFVSDNQNWAIVSRDQIRKTGVSDENLVTKIEDSTIETLLTCDVNVIVDDTNIMAKYISRLAKIGYRCNADVAVRQFDVDIDEAIARVKTRAESGGHFVPEDVVRSQHMRLQKPATLPSKFNPQPIVRDSTKPSAYLFDVDGTLAHNNGKRGPFEWSKVGVDDVDSEVRDICNGLYDTGRHVVIIMSGRDSVCREETKSWFQVNNIWYHQLFMRAENDMRPDEEIKYELFMEHVHPYYDVKAVFDDRNKVVQMWRSIGLKCLQVELGDF
jgi:predicted ABC-type ATPase